MAKKSSSQPMQSTNTESNTSTNTKSDEITSTSENTNTSKKVREPIDPYTEFVKLSDDFKKTSVYNPEQLKGSEDDLTPLEQRRQTRSERLASEKSDSVVYGFKRKALATCALVSAVALAAKGKIQDKTKAISEKRAEKADNRAKQPTQTNNADTPASENTGENPVAKKPAKKKSKLAKVLTVIKRLMILLFCLIIVAGLGVTIFVFSVLQDASDINPHNIRDFLPQNSTMYDIHGNVIDDIFNTPDGRRTNVYFNEIPEHVINAFIAIEDRTFWEHGGFNFVRMVGAVLEAFQGDGRIQGTSTITQQLARNIYLQETRLQRTLDRKILEAYYAFLLERYLTKEEIIENYLNTIQLGFNSSGVQAAAQAYFSKNVWELNLLEAAALAALPQAPSRYALIRRVPNETVEDDNENIISRGQNFTLLYNYAESTERRNLVLWLMREQELITEAQFRAARNDNLRYHINPRVDDATETTSYFADFARVQIVDSLMEEFQLTNEEAWHWLNNRGLRIQTTLDPYIQNIIEREFSNSTNFPNVNFSRMRNSAGNIIGPGGSVLFFSYHNFFDSEGAFTLRPDEFERLPDGSLRIYRGNRLSFFRTEVRGEVDYSVEFRSMYIVDDGTFYSIDGGFIAIPSQYKSRDADLNLIVSSDFFINRPNFFTETDNGGLAIQRASFALNQRVIQPQAAMVVMENETGHLRAMVGGRNIVGRLLFNRADSPRQPGSSIKPIGVYGPALQSAVDALTGPNIQFSTPPDERTFGDFWTAASAINDAPMYLPDGTRWPRNWYNSFRGFSSMRTALEESRNVPAVKVFNEIGPYIASDFMQRIGITSVITEGNVNDMNPAALALGGMTHGISPLEMAGAFACFINEGVYTEPISFTRIYSSSGYILIDRTPHRSQAMDPGVAFIMADILRTNVVSGTNRQAAIGIQPVGGKTGTTNDQFDIWFVGFTPYLTASLWVGNDVNIPLSRGSVAASTLWSRIMRQVSEHEGSPPGRFPSAPANVFSMSVDSLTGGLPGGGGARSEFFVRGTQPTRALSLALFFGEEQTVRLCSVSGHLATPACPQTVYVRGHLVPTFFCFIHNPDPEEFPIDVERPWTPDLDHLEILGPDYGVSDGYGSGYGDGHYGDGNVEHSGPPDYPYTRPDPPDDPHDPGYPPYHGGGGGTNGGSGGGTGGDPGDPGYPGDYSGVGGYDTTPGYQIFTSPSVYDDIPEFLRP